MALHRPVPGRARRGRSRQLRHDPNTFYFGAVRRRRLENDRRRHVLAQRLRWLLHHLLGRRAGGRAVRFECDLRRHRRDDDPHRCLPRRRRLQEHRRRPHLDAMSGCATRATSARSASIRTIPISSGWRRSATPSARTRSAASSRSTDGGATWRQVLFVSDKAGAVDLTLDPRPTRASSTPPIWEAHRTFWQISSGGPDSGLWQQHRRRRDLGEHLRPPGPAQPACWARSAWPPRRRSPAASGL